MVSFTTAYDQERNTTQEHQHKLSQQHDLDNSASSQKHVEREMRLFNADDDETVVNSRPITATVEPTTPRTTDDATNDDLSGSPSPPVLISQAPNYDSSGEQTYNSPQQQETSYNTQHPSPLPDPEAPGQSTYSDPSSTPLPPSSTQPYTPLYNNNNNAYPQPNYAGNERNGPSDEPPTVSEKPPTVPQRAPTYVSPYSPGAYHTHMPKHVPPPTRHPTRPSVLPPRPTHPAKSTKPKQCSGIVCRVSQTASSHPITITLLVVLLILWCYIKLCRSRPDTHGNYRRVAAHYNDDVFGDDYSAGEMDDDDGDDWKRTRSIEMKDIGREEDGGLTLEEMNG